MVGTILPIVYGERRVRERPWSLWLHAAGCIIGGAAVGAVCAAIGGLAGLTLDAATVSGVGIVIAVGVLHGVMALRELGIVRVPLPQSTWQVPRNWLHRLSPRLTAFLYGLLLGPGVFTRITAASFYVVIVWAVVSANPWWGAAILAACGVGRVLPVIMLARISSSGDQMARWNVVLGRWHPVVELTNVLVLAASGMWLLSGAVRAIVLS